MLKQVQHDGIQWMGMSNKFAPRCHSELVSESMHFLAQMLKQVQHDGIQWMLK